MPSSCAGPTAAARSQLVPVHDQSTVWACRLICACGIIGWRRHQAGLDALVAAQWAQLRHSPVIQHDSFEPVLATLAFALWVNVFKLADLYGGHVPVPPSCRRRRRRGVDSSGGLGLHRWKMHGPPRLQREFEGQPPHEFLLRPGHSALAAMAYLGPLFVIDALYPRRTLPPEPPTSAQLLGGVVSSLFLYDFLFFWVHVALHRSAFLFRYVHATHHQQRVLSAKEVVHHGLVDGALQVGANVVALNWLGLHPLTRALHNVAVTYLLTESHAGYDAPWMLHNLVPCKLLGGPPAHEAHHHGGGTHFHQFFTYLDWLPPLLDELTSGGTRQQPQPPPQPPPQPQQRGQPVAAAIANANAAATAALDVVVRLRPPRGAAATKHAQGGGGAGGLERTATSSHRRLKQTSSVACPHQRLRCEKSSQGRRQC
jgi:hypothetical protein